MSAFCSEQFSEYAVIIFTKGMLPGCLKIALQTFNYDAPDTNQSWVGLIICEGTTLKMGFHSLEYRHYFHNDFSIEQDAQTCIARYGLRCMKLILQHKPPCHCMGLAITPKS